MKLKAKKIKKDFSEEKEIQASKNSALKKKKRFVLKTENILQGNGVVVIESSMKKIQKPHERHSN